MADEQTPKDDSLGARPLGEVPTGRSAPIPAQAPSSSDASWQMQQISAGQSPGGFVDLGARSLGNGPANEYHIPKFEKPPTSSSQTRRWLIATPIALVMLILAYFAFSAWQQKTSDENRRAEATAYLANFYDTAFQGMTKEAGAMMCDPEMDTAYRLYQAATKLKQAGSVKMFSPEESYSTPALPMLSSTSPKPKGESLLDGFRAPEYTHFTFVAGQEQDKDGYPSQVTGIVAQGPSATCIVTLSYWPNLIDTVKLLSGDTKALRSTFLTE